MEAVREAFVAYARGEWTMPPKVYVPAYPAGDFRAMPALGGGLRSAQVGDVVPRQSRQGATHRHRARAPVERGGREARGLLRRGRRDSAADGGRSRTRRRGARAPRTRRRCGDRGRRERDAAARTFLARGRAVEVFDVDAQRAERAAADLGARRRTQPGRGAGCGPRGDDDARPRAGHSRRDAPPRTACEPHGCGWPRQGGNRSR